MALLKFDENKYFTKGYKIRIYPTEIQAQIIDRRFELNYAIYNWTIEQEIEQYKRFKSGESNIKFLSFFSLIKLFTIFRHENPWVCEIPYGSAEKSIKRAYNAFEMFFKTKNNFPKFKSKKHIRKLSYGVRHDTMYFENNMLRIEGFPYGDKIYTKWNSGFTSQDRLKYYNPVISKDIYGHYYISFSLVIEKPQSNYCYDSLTDNPIGIDLNVRDRFVCSNGYRSGSPNLHRLIKRKNRIQHQIGKDIRRRKEEARTKSLLYSQIKSSKRAEKRLNHRRKISDKITHITDNFIYHTVNKIINMNPSIIIMENLVVEDMKQKRYISKQLGNSRFNRCIVIMKNKCNQYNIPFKLADTHFPSSQLCSNCGYRQKIFSQKVYNCPQCGLSIDRDLNAAINLKNLAYNI